MLQRAEITRALYSDVPVAWEASGSPVAYPGAVSRMEQDVERIARGEASQRVWLIEHPPLYTAGTGANAADLSEPTRFPVYRTGRGGQYTYHGPGQRVAYVMLDLKRRGRDVRAFVAGLEDWLMAALALLDVRGERREDRVGVWVRRADGGTDEKIAAIGIRIRRWVTYHGVSLNVAPDLEHFSGIVPCGIRGHGVTSLAALGTEVTMSDVDNALQQAFGDIFGPVVAS